jgi:hypothetical protein
VCRHSVLVRVVGIRTVDYSVILRLLFALAGNTGDQVIVIIRMMVEGRGGDELVRTLT